MTNNKVKYILIPYIMIIIIVPAMIAHMPANLISNPERWETALDILMGGAAVLGLACTLLRNKRKFCGWLPLLLLIFLVLLPQIYLWKTEKLSFSRLRIIYRFALLYITLFIIPREIRYTRKELTILIGGLCLFGFGCCIYEVWHDPKFWSTLFEPSGTVRSFFEHRNRFAAYTALWTILCLLTFQLTWRKLWLLPAAFFVFFLYMSKSRGGYLLIAVYLLCALVSYRRRLGTKNLLMILTDILIVFVVLWMIPPVRKFFFSLIALERGVTGRDRIWAVSWGYYREADPLLGHGLGTPIEKIMIERLSQNVSTHNAYLYILNCGGISLVLFYISSVLLLLQGAGHTIRKHYAIPLLIAMLAYGFFELACTPFDFWHLSNMFTVCLFTIPALRTAHGEHVDAPHIN